MQFNPLASLTPFRLSDRQDQGRDSNDFIRTLLQSASNTSHSAQSTLGNLLQQLGNSADSALQKIGSGISNATGNVGNFLEADDKSQFLLKELIQALNKRLDGAGNSNGNSNGNCNDSDSAGNHSNNSNDSNYGDNCRRPARACAY